MLNFCAAIWNEELKMYGVQFHPEVDLTENGMKMIHNFLFGVAGCKGKYSLASRKESCIQHIRDTVGKHKVLVGKTFHHLYGTVDIYFEVTKDISGRMGILHLLQYC